MKLENIKPWQKVWCVTQEAWWRWYGEYVWWNWKYYSGTDLVTKNMTLVWSKDWTILEEKDQILMSRDMIFPTIEKAKKFHSAIMLFIEGYDDTNSD